MKKIIPVIILVAAIGGGYWWFTQPGAAALEAATGSAVLVGSGSIEAETVAIAAELGGRIMEIKVNEGDEVQTGQILVELDKADLLAQQTQFEVAVITAKANLELVSAPPRPEDIAAATAQLAQAEVARDGAELTWNRLSALVNDPHELEIKINQAKAQVTQAESNLELAQVNLKRAEIQAEAAGRNQSNNVGLAENEVAQYQLQMAQTGFEMAQVALAGSKKQVEHLIHIRDNPLPLIAQANAAAAAHQQAEAAVLAAETNLAAVKAGPAAEDVEIARAQLREAETALAAVKVQLAKQTLTAPRAGLISQKLVEVGELAAPGAVLLELSDIDTVDLTVYIPESRIGQVKIGQQARVYVDAYPGQIFEGRVSFIDHQAEFTPRNVQTQEERVNLVFAVKITLDNGDHRLKPGMPADAEILLNAEIITPPTLSPTLGPPVIPPPTPTRVSATPTAKPTPTPAVPAAARQARVVSWALRVRSGPDVNYPVLATLLQGDAVAVVGVDPKTGWLQVQLPGSNRLGWISGSATFVSITGGPDAPAPEPASTATPAAKRDETRMAEIISAGLNVRSGPGVEYPVVATLLKGYSVSVLAVDSASGWLQVSLPGSPRSGWISGDPAYVVLN